MPLYIEGAGAVAGPYREVVERTLVLLRDTDPAVLAGKAKVDAARLDVERTVIRAPVAGVVTHRQVQLGQRVAQGNQIMTIVPVNQLYVDANF